MLTFHVTGKELKKRIANRLGITTDACVEEFVSFYVNGNITMSGV
jgi:hypothetical protein